MADARDETDAEREARCASEYWESHKRLLENASTCEPKMARYWLKLARLAELSAERHDEYAKEDAKLDRLLKLRRSRSHDESIRSEMDNRPRERINAIMREIVEVSKMKMT